MSQAPFSGSPIPAVVVDIAGSEAGGAARWRGELDRYLTDHVGAVRIGRGRRITPGWLVRRERLARGHHLVVAPNNVCFALSGSERRLLLRNALHFLHQSEEHLLARMPRAFRAKIPVVRRLAARADLVVVPCAAMADRVLRHLPALGRRLVVRPHPVTTVGPRQPGDPPVVLVPVVPGPYKNLVTQLRMLVATADRLRHPARVAVTATAADLPPDLAAHPRVRLLGSVPQDVLAERWRSAWAAFYPSSVESFGYPLAEARAYGVPIIAPDTPQARDIAGPALRGYVPTDPRDLAQALVAAAEPPVPEPQAFDRDAYFDFLLDLAPASGGVARAAVVDAGARAGGTPGVGA